MWLWRKDYEELRERMLKAEMRVETLDIHKKSLIGRVKELEAALLKANDDALSARKETLNRPAIPVNLDTLFEDEDSELVEQDRRRAKAEGSTDGLLAMDE